MTFSPDEAVRRVRTALESGELEAGDLTARRLAELLGQTTSLIYHHFKSLDGLLYAVAVSGFTTFAERVEAMDAAKQSLAHLAQSFVTFGLDQPQLYALMLERKWDWAALRAGGHLRPEENMRVWRALVHFFEHRGAAHPIEDARLFQAALHGIVNLALSGRMNVGDSKTSDRDAAIRTAKRLAKMFEA